MLHRHAGRGMDEVVRPRRAKVAPGERELNAELIDEAKCGSTLRHTAELLCRSGFLWDVAERTKMLGLKWHPRQGEHSHSHCSNLFSCHRDRSE